MMIELEWQCLFYSVKHKYPYSFRRLMTVFSMKFSITDLEDFKTI